MKKLLDKAVSVLADGGVIAYPTEYCFGLGCDPRQADAIQKLLAIKKRQASQGVILIAANLAQVEVYAELNGLDKLSEIKASWPGSNTWLLPAKPTVSSWLRGRHKSIAMRIPQHTFCLALCQQFGHAVVSTSANRHGQAAIIDAQQLEQQMGRELDFIAASPVGAAQKASTIRDAITGETFR